jgi:hypothetical protein
MYYLHKGLQSIPAKSRIF